MLDNEYNYNSGEGLDHCGLCKKAFEEGEPVKTIDFPQGPFQLVCMDCVRELKEFANSLPKNNRKQENNIDEKRLKDDDKLWRYMDLAKFISLLKDRTLFFSSPKEFDDIYEGAHGELRNKKAWDDFYLSHARTAIITAPDNCWHSIDKEELEKNALRLIATKFQSPVFISCWHQNVCESEAMWKMYSKNVANAIAIQTSFGKLQHQIGDKVEIKRVRYVDYSRRFVGINDVYWHKRKSFEFENEVRAILFDFESRDKSGVAIEVDINALIHNCYVSPYAPDWFYSLVVDLVRRYQFDFKINRSSMSELPF